MIKRIIFDIDETLLNSNIDFENSMIEYLSQSRFSFTYDRLLKCIEYIEHNFKEYDEEKFLKYYQDNLDNTITINDINDINEYVSNTSTLKNSNTKKILEYLSSKYELICLSNWFYSVQKKRLDIVDISKYFKYIYGFDTLGKKPDVKAFIKACEPYELSECIIIGDSYQNDIVVPTNMGIRAIHLTDEEYDYETIKSIDELMDIL